MQLIRTGSVQALYVGNSSALDTGFYRVLQKVTRKLGIPFKSKNRGGRYAVSSCAFGSPWKYVQKFDLFQIDAFAADSFEKCYCHGTTSACDFQEGRHLRMKYKYYLRAISSRLANFLAKNLLDVVRA